MPRDTSSDVLQGTLDLLVLKSLALGPMHGWGIAQRIQDHLPQRIRRRHRAPSIPPSMRLERRGWIAAEWGTTENNRRARYYRLTPAGQRQLRQETGELAQVRPRGRAGAPGDVSAMPLPSDLARRAPAGGPARSFAAAPWSGTSPTRSGSTSRWRPRPTSAWAGAR